MGKAKSGWTKIIIVVIVVAIAGLAYSLYAFYSSGAADRGIVVCNPNNATDCLWQDHMHALVIISVDGQTQDLPVERGPLDKAHTHEERNVIHWHSQLTYDPINDEVIDKSDFTISNSLNSVGFQLPEGGKLFVKRSDSWSFGSDYGSFVWTDKDLIYIAKDGRSNEEVMQFLETSGLSLPYLGAG